MMMMMMMMMVVVMMMMVMMMMMMMMMMLILVFSLFNLSSGFASFSSDQRSLPDGPARGSC